MRCRATPALRASLAVALALLGLVGLVAAGRAAPAARAQEGYPAIETRVTDRADILGPRAEAELEARLERLERDTGAQVVVLTVGSLEGRPIEDYALSVAEVERWGREGVDDGVLLLVARDDRELRIEVGYGLEGAIPDAIANRIIDERIVPAFQAGDFDGGVTAGVVALDELVRGEPLPPPAPRDEPGDGFDGGEAFTGLFIAMLWMLIALSRRGVVAWLLYLLMAPLFFVIPYLIVGTPLAWVSLVLWLLLFPPLKWAASRAGLDGPDGGVWLGGGFGGGGGGGGGGFSGGGGGFSGGGGGFGGGGASGSW